MTIKEIRESTGLSQVEFSQKYSIPVRSLGNWETGSRKCPEYLVELLERAVNEDNAAASLKTYDPSVLKELGSIYRDLLFVLNKNGHNPYPQVDIYPVKYFVIVFTKATSLHIPAELDERIRLLLNSLDVEDWTNSINVPCPMDKRQYFTTAMLGY